MSINKILNISKSDEYTKLLLHCDGADESTSFIDSSPSAHTITAYGDAQLDTSEKKFGTASGLFSSGSDYIKVPASSDWYFSDGDFTIDFWINLSDISGEQYFMLTYRIPTWSDFLYIKKESTSHKLHFGARRVGAERGNFIMTNDWSVSADTWYHIAFVRNGSNPHMFIDGESQILTTNSNFGTLGNALDAINFGGYNTTSRIKGRIDEVRISKGIARWTSNFTPSSSAYSSALIGKVSNVEKANISKILGATI